VKLGDFLNEYAANPQVIFPLVVTIIFTLVIFGYFYNRLMDKLRGKEHTSIYVAGGVIVTITAAALISWKSALLFAVLFVLDGIFMMVGEYKRTERKQRSAPRRKRMGYAANGLIDEAKMSATEIHRLMGKELEAHEPGILLKIQRELTTILLRLEELKKIQE
jgi:hypothetical protein